MASKSSKFRNSYELVTERVIEAIQRNMTVPWRRPWRTDGIIQLPSNFLTKRPYQGVNVFLLTMMGYQSPWWISFKQAASLGGSVRKGERGTPIIFWTIIERQDADTGETQKLPVLRHSTVFNIEQCEHIEVPSPPRGERSAYNLIGSCEAIGRGFRSGPTIREQGDSAFYSITSDLVNVPPRTAFESIEEFYSTLWHELTHSTAHQTRLNRKFTSAQAFMSESYSKEELIAEMGASLLCAKAGIDDVTFGNSVAYLQGWVAALQEKPKMLIEAASAAQRAVDHILGEPRETSGLEQDTFTKGKIETEVG